MLAVIGRAVHKTTSESGAGQTLLVADAGGMPVLRHGRPSVIP